MIVRQSFPSISNNMNTVKIKCYMFSPVSEFLYNFKKSNISTTLCVFFKWTITDFDVTTKKLPSDSVHNIDQHLYINQFYFLN